MVILAALWAGTTVITLFILLVSYYVGKHENLNFLSVLNLLLNFLSVPADPFHSRQLSLPAFEQNGCG